MDQSLPSTQQGVGLLNRGICVSLILLDMAKLFS